MIIVIDQMPAAAYRFMGLVQLVYQFPTRSLACGSQQLALGLIPGFCKRRLLNVYKQISDFLFQAKQLTSRFLTLAAAWGDLA